MSRLHSLRRLLVRERAGVPVWGIAIIAIAIAVAASFVTLRSVASAQPASAAWRPAPAAVAPTATSTLPPLPKDPKALIFGDSYTYGTAASPLTKGYAHLVADEEGWTARIDGVGGTGYMNGGPYAKPLTFTTRMSKIIAAKQFTPDIVLIEGSQNDWASVADLRPAVASLVRMVRAAWPHARIILFGPAAPQPAMSTLGNIDSQVAAGAYDADVPYISPYQEGWFTVQNTKSYGAADGAHLTTAGHRYLADRLIADLKPLLQN